VIIIQVRYLLVIFFIFIFLSSEASATEIKLPKDATNFLKEIINAIQNFINYLGNFIKLLSKPSIQEGQIPEGQQEQPSQPQIKKEGKLEISKIDLKVNIEGIGPLNKLTKFDCIHPCSFQVSGERITLSLDDPDYDPKSLYLSLNILLKNVGNDDLNNIDLQVYSDNNLEYSTSLSLPVNSERILPVELRYPLTLGKASHNIEIKAITLNRTLTRTYNLDIDIKRAVLEMIEDEISFDSKIELKMWENRGYRASFFSKSCQELEGCSEEVHDNIFSLSLNKPPYEIQNIHVEIKIPFKNVGNIKSSLITAMEKYSDRSLIPSTSYLNPGEKGYIIYEYSITANGYSSSEKRDLNFEINIGKGPGKSLSKNIKLEIKYEQFCNPSCSGSCLLTYLYPEIKEKASEITSKASTDYEKVDAIYKWVYKNIKMTGHNVIFPPSATLTEGYGDCDTKSILVVTLARAAGVTVNKIRVVTGKLGNVGHAWVEFYHEGHWYRIEMNEVWQDIFAKLGFPLNIWASDKIARFGLFGIYKEEEWFNDMECGKI
jgi:hypothetical protein